MFYYYYAKTKDRKGNEHNYKLPSGIGIPKGHEITDLSIADRWKVSEIIGPETETLLRELVK